MKRILVMLLVLSFLMVKTPNAVADSGLCANSVSYDPGLALRRALWMGYWEADFEPFEGSANYWSFLGCDMYPSLGAQDNVLWGMGKGVDLARWLNATNVIDVSETVGINYAMAAYYCWPWPMYQTSLPLVMGGE